jgi:hypothetical protein
LSVTVTAPVMPAPLQTSAILQRTAAGDAKSPSDTAADIEGNDVHRYTPTTQPLSQQMLFRLSGTQTGTYFYEARLGRDQPLPSWIFFDSSTQVVTAIPDSQVAPGIYVVRVIARDASGREAESILTIHVLRDSTRSQDILKLKTGSRVTPLPAVIPLRQEPAVTPLQQEPAVTPLQQEPAVTPLQQGPSETPGGQLPQGEAPQQVPTNPLPGATQEDTQPNQTGPAASSSDAPDTRSELRGQPTAEAFDVADTRSVAIYPANELINLASSRDGETKCASLTQTLHGLGSTGRMIEAARFLEELAAESQGAA